jgi:hypothetical protein
MAPNGRLTTIGCTVPPGRQPRISVNEACAGFSVPFVEEVGQKEENG